MSVPRTTGLRYLVSRSAAAYSPGSHAWLCLRNSGARSLSVEEISCCPETPTDSAITVEWLQDNAGTITNALTPVPVDGSNAITPVTTAGYDGITGLGVFFTIFSGRKSFRYESRKDKRHTSNTSGSSYSRFAFSFCCSVPVQIHAYVVFEE